MESNRITNSEIDKLEAGRELDALIAEKVMGWKVYDYGEWKAGLWETEEIVHPNVMYGGGLTPEDWLWYQAKPNTTGNPWSPSRQISAAWEVVEQLGNTLTLQGPGSVDFNEGCGPWDTWEAGFGDQAWDFEHRATASTVALAICRAALKAANNNSKGETRAN